MSYYNVKIIAQYTTTEGIIVIVKEGLNCKRDWELRLVIPKQLWADYNTENFLFDKKDSLYFGTDAKTGRCRYYHYDTPSTGFSGSKHKITLLDGTSEILIGPWSSRTECMNLAGFEPCKEVNIESQYNMADNLTLVRINGLLLPLDMECILIDNNAHIIRL